MEKELMDLSCKLSSNLSAMCLTDDALQLDERYRFARYQLKELFRLNTARLAREGKK